MHGVKPPLMLQGSFEVYLAKQEKSVACHPGRPLLPSSTLISSFVARHGCLLRRRLLLRGALRIRGGACAGVALAVLRVQLGQPCVPMADTEYDIHHGLLAEPSVDESLVPDIRLEM